MASSPPTLAQVFLRGLAHSKAGQLFAKEGEEWIALSSKDLFQRVVRLHVALRSLGLRRGARCALLSENRWEWVVCDFALMTSGMVSVPLEASVTPEQLYDALKITGCRCIFVSTPAQRDKVVAIRKELPALDSVVVFTGGSCGGPTSRIFSFSSLVRGGPPTEQEQEAFQASISKVQPEDPASLDMPDATGGNLMTHGAWTCRLEDSRLEVGSDDVVLSFLRLGRCNERAWYYRWHLGGAAVTPIEGSEDLQPILQKMKPTVLAAPSEELGKIHNYVRRDPVLASPGRQQLFRRALQVTHEAAPYRSRSQRAPVRLEVQLVLFDHYLFKPLRGRLGGRVQRLLAAGAPAPADTVEFLGALGLPVLEIGEGVQERTAPPAAHSEPQAAPAIRVSNVPAAPEAAEAAGRRAPKRTAPSYGQAALKRALTAMSHLVACTCGAASLSVHRGRQLFKIWQAEFRRARSVWDSAGLHPSPAGILPVPEGGAGLPDPAVEQPGYHTLHHAKRRLEIAVNAAALREVFRGGAAAEGILRGSYHAELPRSVRIDGFEALPGGQRLPGSLASLDDLSQFAAALAAVPRQGGQLLGHYRAVGSGPFRPTEHDDFVSCNYFGTSVFALLIRRPARGAPSARLYQRAGGAKWSAVATFSPGGLAGESRFANLPPALERAWKMTAVAAGVLTLAFLTYQTVGRGWLSYGDEGIGLKVGVMRPALEISWAPDKVRDAAFGLLTISGNQFRRVLHLTEAELRQGRIVFIPDGPDTTVTLEITTRDGDSRSETLKIIEPAIGLAAPERPVPFLE